MDFIFNENSFTPDSDSSFSYNDLYNLAFKPLDKGASVTEKYLKSIADLFLSTLLESTGFELERENVSVSYDKSVLSNMASEVPFALGSQYVNEKWVKKQLDQLLDIYKKEISSFSGGVDLYFNSKNGSLDLPSRIYFHLVLNPKGSTPFAFMATYTTIENGLVHHYPLRYALSQYKDDLEAFSLLLSPVSRLSKSSALIKRLVESGEIFHPLNFTENEADIFLHEANEYEEAGIVCRIPDFWKRRGKSTSVSIIIKNQVSVDLASILLIQPSLIYEGVKVTQKDVKELLSKTEGLAFLKGKWVDVDKKKLQALLDSASIFSSDMPISDLVAYSAGLKKGNVKITFPDKNWLSSVLESVSSSLTLPKKLDATLRPYQFDGYKYLYGMNAIGFGICLADDMGLGKTVQVLSLLEKLREEGNIKKVLLVVPSSLLGNWESEIVKFTPSITYTIYHGSNRELIDAFLTITTYGVVAKDELLSAIKWDKIILDEAQYIKNSGTKASKSLRALNRNQAMILTGTPIENNLGNLWSLMDFINPGFLGSKTEFSRIAKEPTIENISKLRSAISPFILRRLKSDKKIISDLPDKVENDMSVELSKAQIILYKKVVNELEEMIDGKEESFETKGLVLNTILKLKQICNHPDQYNGLTTYKSSDSGKFELLKELATTIHENREKVLVFTQFKELIPALDDLLYSVFETRGYTIDGSVNSSKRTQIVKEFQSGKAPYMVLSLRAAGVGLNLTAARNVIHFDRWWNPAVENQATDRAYRIGQKEKVMVYKFVTKDTIEERINDMILSKQALADSLLSDLSSDIFSKLSSKEILKAMKFTGGKR